MLCPAVQALQHLLEQPAGLGFKFDSNSKFKFEWKFNLLFQLLFSHAAGAAGVICEACLTGAVMRTRGTHTINPFTALDSDSSCGMKKNPLQTASAPESTYCGDYWDLPGGQCNNTALVIEQTAHQGAFRTP